MDYLVFPGDKMQEICMFSVSNNQIYADKQLECPTKRNSGEPAVLSAVGLMNLSAKSGGNAIWHSH
jgi:hypothetical protein